MPTQLRTAYNLKHIGSGGLLRQRFVQPVFELHNPLGRIDHGRLATACGLLRIAAP
jgi:hypothetical protein